MRNAVVLAAALAAAAEAQAFDVVALVDSLDFAKVYDIETRTGMVQVLDHVLRTHATEVWWRDKGGGVPRFPSKCEMSEFDEAPFDKKRLPREDIFGYLRLASPRGNAFPVIRQECLRRGLAFGIHTTIEENHWCAPLASNWTIAHPEFWAFNCDGILLGRICSIMWPEVVEHKLEMLDERIALGPKRIMLDFRRNGGWSFAVEYTAPALAEWRRLYGDEPVPGPTDARWRKMIGAHFDDYLRRFSAKCRAAGIEFVCAPSGVDERDDAGLREDYSGPSWRHLAREGVFDAVFPMTVRIDASDPFGSAGRVYRNVADCCGKTKVYFPLSAYSTAYGSGINQIAKVAKISAAEATKRLMKLAMDVGARGVVMECVDYGNYTAEMCDAIAEALRRE